MKPNITYITATSADIEGSGGVDIVNPPVLLTTTDDIQGECLHSLSPSLPSSPFFLPSVLYSFFPFFPFISSFSIFSYPSPSFPCLHNIKLVPSLSLPLSSIIYISLSLSPSLLSLQTLIMTTRKACCILLLWKWVE